MLIFLVRVLLKILVFLYCASWMNDLNGSDRIQVGKGFQGIKKMQCN